MSQRTDIRDALVAAITAANPGVTVAKWDGEEAVFNAARHWPSISVAYAGTEFGDQEELGDPGPATYARHQMFHVFVCTIHGAQEGDAHALAIMEAAETTVAGQVIAGLGTAEVVGEELVHVHMGRFLYVQTWRITLLESH